MHGVYSDTALVLPADWLVWLATSSARLAVYRLQGWHGVFRVAHIAGTATGRLGLHGLTHAVSIPLTGVVTASTRTVDGEFTVLLTDYGIPRPSLMFKPIEDEVRVTVHGVGAVGG